MTSLQHIQAHCRSHSPMWRAITFLCFSFFFFCSHALVSSWSSNATVADELALLSFKFMLSAGSSEGSLASWNTSSLYCSWPGVICGGHRHPERLLVVATTLSLASQSQALHLPRRPGTSACLPHERDALLAFKEGITAYPADLLASWRRGKDCCRWRGVRCSNRTGHVLKLHLRAPPSCDLYGGEISPCSDKTALVGQISSSLLSLEHLEHLDLSWNSLAGPNDRLPEFLGSLKSLRYLNLSGMSFTGVLPPQLGNLSNLQYLDLSRARRSVQSTDISWLTHMPWLRHLDLTGMNLGMVSDWPHVVNMIPTLRVLSLSACGLTSANQSVQHLSLTKLEKLDLSYNPFEHTFASCWFWNLTSLKYLDLEDSGLFGGIPDALAGMTSLQFFDFSSNYGSTMTPNLMRNLCNLEVLNLGFSLSSGNMTVLFEDMSHCSSSKLRKLDLSGNNMTGTLPTWIGQFASLVTLDLSYNHLTGHVPYEISMLTNLTRMSLGSNDLHGDIREEHFAGLQRLTHIDLSYNHLKIAVGPEWLPPFRLEEADFASCQMGPQFPAWLQHQVDIDWIDMSNTGIEDQIPDWFSTAFAKATLLDISSNRISGGLPTNMEIMSLQQLFVQSNQLTGPIPLLPRNLTTLDFSENSLSGSLPSHFGAPNLESISLFSNYLSGHIPGSVCELQKLTALDLANNILEGEFPRCSGMTDMTALVLRNNSFCGMFPPFLQGCIQLEILDLSRNKFSGRLPMWIGDLMGLEYLRLSFNLFDGNIPFNITNLAHLYDLNLAGNRLSGAVPCHLSNLTRMKYAIANDDDNWINDVSEDFSVTTKWKELYYPYLSLPDMVSIDLSLNFLTGGIPEEIVSLAQIKNLNLSRNNLTGEIPDKIGSMRSLESLDLSRNKLSGELPQSLSDLTYLSTLDLSCNNLSGRIPSGSQLDTLYDESQDIYSGNIGLCGRPLPRNCSSGIASKHGDDNGDDEYKRAAQRPEPNFFYLGLGLGFVFGLWVVFCTLLFKKTWRIGYFRFFNKVYNKIYVFVVVTWTSLAQKRTAH